MKWLLPFVFVAFGCQAIGNLFRTPSSTTYIPPESSVGGEVPLGPDGSGGTLVVPPGSPGQSLGQDIGLGLAGIIGLVTGNPAIGAAVGGLFTIIGSAAAQRGSRPA